MLAVLLTFDLNKYIARDSIVPRVEKEGQPTEEIEAQRKWREGHALPRRIDPNQVMN